MDDKDRETFVGSLDAQPATPVVQSGAYDKSELVVGRAGECDIVINDERVSRQHARLKVTPGGLWLKDLGSRLGTKINGQRIEVSVRIRPGDSLVLGAVSLSTADDPLKTLLLRSVELEAV